MKTIHNPSNVIALWLNQSQNHASNASKNFYFTGGTIYSYGHHFAIARHVTCNGKKAIFLTTACHSQTTAKHINLVRKALQGHMVFNVSDVNAYSIEDCTQQMDRYQVRLDMLADEYCRAKDKEKCFNRFNAVKDEANNFAKFTTLKRRIRSDVKKMAAKLAKMLAEHKARQLKQKANDTKQRNAWLAGKPVAYPSDGTTRLRCFGNCTQLSNGQNIPTEDIVRLAKFVKLLNGSPWTRQLGLFCVGVYTLDSVDEQGNVNLSGLVIPHSDIQKVAA